jgi:heme iron utilization protein
MPEKKPEEVEQAARQGAERAGGVSAIRGLLAQEQVGVLSTLSLRRPGWPYGTLVPFAVARSGAPLFLLSGLAQHTHNLQADPRASLLVFDGGLAAQDPRTAPRVTLAGRVVRIPPSDEADAREHYLARHPDGRGLLELDFALWALEVEEAQLVAGFAAAGFFSGTELLPPAP